LNIIYKGRGTFFSITKFKVMELPSSRCSRRTPQFRPCKVASESPCYCHAAAVDAVLRLPWADAFQEWVQAKNVNLLIFDNNSTILQPYNDNTIRRCSYLYIFKVYTKLYNKVLKIKGFLSIDPNKFCSNVSSSLLRIRQNINGLDF